MKTNYLNQIKKGTIIILTLALGLSACKKDQSSALNEKQLALAGNWRLNDMMQTNNEDGRPQGNDVSSLNYSSIQLGSQGTFTASGAENGKAINGSWTANGEQLSLKKADGESILLNIVSAKGDSLTLAQNYPATANLASGTIYYALNK